METRWSLFEHLNASKSSGKTNFFFLTMYDEVHKKKKIQQGDEMWLLEKKRTNAPCTKIWKTTQSNATKTEKLEKPLHGKSRNFVELMKRTMQVFGFK